MVRLRLLSVAGGTSLLALTAARLGVAQQPLQAVQGVVRDSSGVPLGGAEVVVGPRRATTGPQGLFRVDSLRPGQYTVTIRLIGYYPVRSRVAVVAAEPTQVAYYMVRAPVLLPTMIVESHRTGIYGSVGDTAFRAAVGARVQVSGPRGGEVRTDSLGRFAFPELSGGQYMVRVTFSGYTERRFLVQLKSGEGRELAVLLAPYREPPSRGDDVALLDLGKRLSVGLERERMTSQQLERYTSLPLCDLPRLQSELGRDRNATIFISVNGVTTERLGDVNRLCAWRADEVELVEFGPDVCRDVTGSIPELFGVWCSGRSRNVPRSMVGSGQRIGTQAAGQKYVIIWEKK